MKDGLSKDQSKMLQGLAILMMLYHHLFSTPEALGATYRSLLSFGSVNAELKMAWFFKICVGIYAFVSGYGLCRSFNSNPGQGSGSSSLTLKAWAARMTGELRFEGGFWRKLAADYRKVLQRLWSFYTQYLLVFVLFVPIGFLFFQKPFVPSEFLFNLLGLSSSYNGAWWYVLQYYKMLLILPLADGFFTWFLSRKQRILQIAFYGVCIILCIVLAFLPAGRENALTYIVNSLQPAFTLCFLTGYLIARLRLYELCYALFAGGRTDSFVKNEARRVRGERLLTVLGFLAFFAVIAARVHVAKDASSAGLDFLFVPVFAFGFLKIIELWSGAGKLFSFFGKYSTFIWLTHVFYYDHYLKPVVMASRVSLGIYLTLLALSLAGAILLQILYGALAISMKGLSIHK